MRRLFDFKHLEHKNNNMIYTVLISLLSFIILCIIYLSGGSHLGTSSIMFIPIFLFSRRFHILGGSIAGIVFGLLLWLVIPLDVERKMMTELTSSVISLSIFVTFGVVVGYYASVYEKRNYTSKMILSKINNAYCFIDTKGIIRYYNDSFFEYLKDILDLTKFENEDIKNRKFLEVFTNSSYENENSISEIIMNYIDNKKSSYDFPMNVAFKGQKFVLNHRVDTLMVDNKNCGVLLSIKDYKARHDFIESIEGVKNVDDVTGLYNRRYFNNFISHLALENFPHGFIVLQIDNFQSLQLKFGEKYCEEIFRQTANAIRDIIVVDSLCSKYDSNQFVLYLPNATNEKITLTIKSIIEKVKVDENIIMSYGYYIRESLLVSTLDCVNFAVNNMTLYRNVKSNEYSDNSVNIIMKVLQEKDSYSEMHSKSVGLISKELAIRYGVPMNEVTEIWYAALLHDIGKIIVPEDILQKDGKLTILEYEKMKEHSEIGYRLLDNVDGMKRIANIVLSHHERFDGKGYPNNSEGKLIPLGSRIISIADTYNAIVTDRSYRTKRESAEALEEIIKCSGKQFDPDIVDIFKNNFEEIVLTV